MAEIQINVRGRIRAGRWVGQYLTVEDQVEKTGGYLIVVEANAGGENGGDFWVDKADLARAFEEADLEVEWEATDGPEVER